MSAPLSILKKFRMNVRAALGSEAGLKGKRRKGRSRAAITIPLVFVIVMCSGFSKSPLDLSSYVHPLNSSWISSGSTSLRAQASSQCGFGGGAGTAPFLWTFFFFDFGVATPPSLSLFLSLENRPILTSPGLYLSIWIAIMGIASLNSRLANPAGSLQTERSSDAGALAVGRRCKWCECVCESQQ